VGKAAMAFLDLSVLRKKGRRQSEDAKLELAVWPLFVYPYFMKNF
jgi:hypothetical protein